ETEARHIDRKNIVCDGAIVNRKNIKRRGPELVTTREIKAARALLGWSQEDLAARSGVYEPTVARLESVDGVLGGRATTVQKIEEALQAAGIEFIDENGGGPGVRLRVQRTRKRAP